MEMINKTVYQDLQAAGMAEAQAQVVAAHIPDWSQFATKQDLRRWENRLDQQMSELKNSLLRWMVLLIVGPLLLGEVLSLFR